MTQRGSCQLEDLTPGARVAGVAANGAVTVIAAEWHGNNAVTLTFRDDVGGVVERLLYRDHEAGLVLEAPAATQSFDARGNDFKLAAEALRIRMAARFDPMLAVTTSNLRALPHQIKAVYGELLPRTPLRFLLADDPGAGKTIMAGLYIKELLLRGDLARCLIVAPGGLVEQWQEELFGKFDLRFELLTRDKIEADIDGNVFDAHPRLIARMDQLSRSDELLVLLENTDWDLVVVDEAHRMSAHYFGSELKTTRRYGLGLLLGRIARHLLLMTATPHAGLPADFQLFLALLDADRFEGRYRDGVHSIDTGGLMRRMVKEDLLTFEGKPLFPERHAYTVEYRLSSGEMALYQAVTQYVREEMNRADQLRTDGEAKRSTTVGFALTVLQRRLASSPEAIWRSLQRRRARLERRRTDMLAVGWQAPLEERLTDLLGRSPLVAEAALADDLDDFTSEEREQLEESVVDAATAARTVAELETEIRVLTDLEELARRVRVSETDKKWTELRDLLSDHAQTRDENGRLRKIIIFTEHRDTLHYLVGRIRTLLGNEQAVVSIHGGDGREERRKTQELFTQHKDVRVLVATDAAGEGLNLQRAHLMVNYDLPWNPNRIEQRFGRIHRIGQEEVCHLWNLVATETREGAVFQRLLAKIEEQREAYGGRIFDVLGETFEGVPLRSLLIDAVRYGDQPQVRARLNEIIDAQVSEGLDQLLAERALSQNAIADRDVEEIRIRLEEARARKLQPHFIHTFFAAAFARLGGHLSVREPGRFEIAHVPAALRARDRRSGLGAPLLDKYERITFEPSRTQVPGKPPAALVAPGHPLLDAVIDLTIEQLGTSLKQGAILVDPNDSGTAARVLVAVTQEITDGHQPAHTVSKRFDFVEIDQAGGARSAGPAPYLDYDTASDSVSKIAESIRLEPWLCGGIEQLALDWSIDNGVHQQLAAVESQLKPQVERIREQVKHRLRLEINYWDAEHGNLLEQQSVGKRLKISPETAHKRARDLEARLERRLRQLDADERLQVKPPVIAGGALIIPAGLLSRAGATVPTFARNTQLSDRRAVAAVLAAEAELGRNPREMPHNNPGYDILSIDRDGRVIFIEVKGRIQGATDVVVTRTEVLVGKNQGADHRLALVEISPEGADSDNVRYVVDAFAKEPDPSFEVTKLVYQWRKLWARGGDPR